MQAPLSLPSSAGKRCWINLSELDVLVPLLPAGASYEGACMVDVLGLLALVIPALSHHAHEVKTLRAAGETADKRGGTLVLAALNLYAYCVYHSGRILARGAYLRQQLEALPQAHQRG